MSWTDICSNCGDDRASCTCGDWCGYEKKIRKKNSDTKEITNGDLGMINLHIN